MIPSVARAFATAAKRSPEKVRPPSSQAIVVGSVGIVKYARPTMIASAPVPSPHRMWGGRSASQVLHLASRDRNRSSVERGMSGLSVRINSPPDRIRRGAISPQIGVEVSRIGRRVRPRNNRPIRETTRSAASCNASYRRSPTFVNRSPRFTGANRRVLRVPAWGREAFGKPGEKGDDNDLTFGGAVLCIRGRRG